jgi:hypothetical protein
MRLTFSVFLIMSFLMPAALSAKPVCINSGHGHLVDFDVFDGDPSELADLIGQETGPNTGYFDLAYIYQSGRVVTINCKYSDGIVISEKQPPIKGCSYFYSPGGKVSLSCR